MTEFKNIEAPRVESFLWREVDLTLANQAVKESKDPSNVRLFSQPIPENSPELVLPNGGKISFGSTQPKKMADANKVFKALRANVEIIDPVSLLHWFLSAEEVSQTFTGNAYEKVQSILERIYGTLGYDQFISRLKERGIDPDEFVFLVNDCGSYLNVDYSDEPEFKKSAHKLGLGAWPGVETGPINDAQGGVRQFYSSLHSMAERKKDLGEAVDLRGVDHQTYMAFKIVPTREDVKIFEFSSYVPVTFCTKPAPGVLDSEVLNYLHFVIPHIPGISSEYIGKRAAEIGDVYLARYGAEHHALKAFLEKAQVPESMRPGFNGQAEISLPTNFKIATQHNGFPSQYKFMQRPDFSAYSSRMKMRTDSYNPRERGAYTEMTKGAEAVVFGYHSPEITNNWDDYVLGLMDMWCTFIVDKQVSVESFSGRPFAVINPSCNFSFEGKTNGQLDWTDPRVEKGFLNFISDIDPRENPWGQMINFTRYLHEAGFVKQEPQYLYDQYSPDDPDLVDRIEKSIIESYPDRLETPDYGRETYGDDRSGMCELSILGSAGTWVDSYLKAAYEIGKFGVERGMHVRSGGGNHGIMGNGGRGAVENMGDRTDAHYSAIPMPRTMQFEGCYPAPEVVKDSINQCLTIEPSFDERMHNIFRSDILVGLAGGIGTYAEIIRFMRWKEAGVPGVQDKKMILLNDEPPGGAGVISTFDVFLQILPEKYKNEDLIIVHDLDSLKREIDYEYLYWLEKKRKPIVSDLTLS